MPSADAYTSLADPSVDLPPRGPDASTDEAQLLRALRRGDEQAFAHLVDTFSPALLGLAMRYVPSRAAAEEVVQETWLGVIRGLDRFQGRSSLKTWIFKILTNTAKTRGVRERRTIPFSSLVDARPEPDEPAVDPDRFLPQDHDRLPGHWAVGPTDWGMPEQDLLSGETLRVILRAIEALPPAQGEVIRLRDVQGFTAQDVCDALRLSPENQRVLLHRARSKIRRAVEAHLGATAPTT